MRILILGATGFIGPYVVRKLFNEGQSVAVFHRGKTDADLPDRVEYILGDRNDLSSFRKDFEKFKPRVVIDMIPFTEQDAETVMRAFNGIAERVVAISSM